MVEGASFQTMCVNVPDINPAEYDGRNFVLNIVQTFLAIKHSGTW